ncbi:MAG TPA: hypothetical protein PKM59_03335 [Thermodesulfobacteriota bacterium]|nr:hypothetical protein [Thermodesulfobacteriota bacterium]
MLNQRTRPALRREQLSCLRALDSCSLFNCHCSIVGLKNQYGLDTIRVIGILIRRSRALAGTRHSTQLEGLAGWNYAVGHTASEGVIV